MNPIEFLITLIKDPRTVILGWIAVLGPVGVFTPLFLVVFIETGVVFFPFLPGDSLIFAAGVFSAEGGVPDGGQNLNIFMTLFVFYAAAILGNTSNYFIAHFFGKRIIDSGKIKGLTQERMDKLNYFFDRYGGMTVVITRFMPFFRTFAPFMCGLGKMNFLKFTIFNVIGGVLWVSVFALLGYFFGGVPFVQQHFSIIVIGIVVISVLPAIIGVIKAAAGSSKKKKAAKVTTESIVDSINQNGVENVVAQNKAVKSDETTESIKTASAKLAADEATTDSVASKTKERAVSQNAHARSERNNQ